MTTSNPVVPHLEAVAQSRARHSQAGSHVYRPGTSSSWWALSDSASIALILIFLRQFFSLFVPDGQHAVAIGFPAALFIGASACTLLFWPLGVYSALPSPLNIHETEQLLRGTSIIALVSTIGASYVDFHLALITLTASILGGLLLIAQRGFVRRILFPPRERIRVLIYARRFDGDLLAIIHTVSARSIELAGLLCDSPWELSWSEDTPCRFVGTLNELKRAAKQTGASHVLVVGCDLDSGETQSILDRCERLKLQCYILLDPRSFSNAHFAYTFMHELPVLQRPPVGIQPQFRLKRIIDLAVGSSLSVLALPIGILMAAVIKYDSRGPVFFRQQRIGVNGRPFELLKFRTMHIGSPKYARSPASACDPRITRFGRLLRRLSLDELPQLLNVLKGDMSLVGPRPEMPFIVDQYNAAAWGRLAVRPGITGLWQISRGRSLPIHHNLHYDLFYIERQSIFLDAAILLRTFGAVVRGIGAT